MATIVAAFEDSTGITGQSSVAGFADHVAVIGLRETIELGVPASGSGGAGKPKHSDFQLIRFRDSSSPKLAEACANAIDVGSVVITVFRTAGTGVVQFMQYLLSDGVYVSRIEQETLDEQHMAFGPHLMAPTRGLPVPGPAGLTSVLAPVVNQAVSAGRLLVNPLDVSDNYSNQEVERVNLNANAVTWSYTPYDAGRAQGKVSAGYNLATGATR